MKSTVMDDTKLIKYKTVMCQRMVRAGSCRYGHLCDFAHDSRELRRNLNQHWYSGVRCDKPDHDERKCDFAHTDMEVMYHPNVYKTKMCEKFSTPQGCPKNQYCSYAHGKGEFRQAKYTKSTLSQGQQQQRHEHGGGMHERHSRNASYDPAPKHYAHQHQQSPLTPVHAGTPMRQTSFSTPQEMHSMGGMTMSMGEMKEFQDSTNDLKIRILDLVDQISAMHFDRAVMDHEKAKGMLAGESAKLNALLQDAYSRLQQTTQENVSLSAQYTERISTLQQHLQETQENLRRQTLLAQAQRGNKDALKHMSPAAILQLQQQNQAAAAALAEAQGNASSASGAVKDLSELSVLELSPSPQPSAHPKSAAAAAAAAAAAGPATVSALAV